MVHPGLVLGRAEVLKPAVKPLPVVENLDELEEARRTCAMVAQKWR
jgi:hypothetical protein